MWAHSEADVAELLNARGPGVCGTKLDRHCFHDPIWTWSWITCESRHPEPENNRAARTCVQPDETRHANQAGALRGPERQHLRQLLRLHKVAAGRWSNKVVSMCN
jgi:hypothetical protein